mgnify:FL=1
MKRVNFIATDGVKLNGFLYQSENNKKSEKIILSVHGMSSNCLKERETTIAQKANENGIDYFCFNNRGSELVKYIEKDTGNGKEKMLAGTSYEDVTEGYEDIVGAIIKLKEMGYTKIYLQGHSLGCTKIVYTYNELQEEQENDILECIKGIILLSLIDIPTAIKIYLRENYTSYLRLAEEKEQEGKEMNLMPKESFIHPISVKTFLRYARDNKSINFANYSEDSNLEILNKIDKPLFMRWGNVNEMILQKADELVSIVSNKLENKNKDIDYIDGADHSYTGKHEILAEQIIEFIKEN